MSGDKPVSFPTEGSEPAGRFDLAILAGYGSLPVEIAQEASRSGKRVLMIGIEGEAGESIREFEHLTLGWGQLGRLFKLLKNHEIGEVAFAGGVARRPDLLKMKLDLGAILSLPQVLAFMLGGDNTVLTGAMKLFEKRGIQVVGIADIAPSLLAKRGRVAGRAPTAAEMRCIRLAGGACKALGRFDIGQAAVAEGARVVAVEGVEGTDGLLARIRQMRDIGRLPAQGKHGVLVKTLKPGQDMRADLPAIGPLTVEAVVAAGLNGIALEAGHAVILEKERTLRAAEQAEIFIHGVDPAEFEHGGV